METRGDTTELPATYAALYRALQAVDARGWANKSYVAAAVTRKGGRAGGYELFLARAARAGEGHDTEPQKVEYARLDPGLSAVPEWHVAGLLLGPLRPAIAAGPDGTAYCVLTGIRAGEDLGGASPFAARRRVFAFEIEAGKSSLFEPGFGEALETLSASLGEGRRLWILGQPWHLPVADQLFWPLRVAATAAPTSAAFSTNVANTDKPLSVRQDYQIIAGASEAHAVFAAVDTNEGPKAPEHYWHDTLDSEGRTVKRADLGTKEDGEELVSMFVGPKGSLLMLTIVQSRGVIRSHRIRDLGVALSGHETGEQYFVDEYLGLHAVWFEGDQTRYVGPTRLDGFGVYE